MADPNQNPLIDYAKSQASTNLAEAQVAGQLLVAQIRAGEVDTHQVAEIIRQHVYNGFSSENLLGFADALVAALRRQE